MQEAAVVLMQGGGFQIYHQPTRSGHIVEPIIAQEEAVAAFCRARQAVSHKSATVPQVALLLSSESFWDRSDAVFSPWGDVFLELEGALHALLNLHYSVDILAEHQLGPRLKEFPLVVVPDSHKLTNEFRQALTDYVVAGGSLLLLGEKCARLFEPILGVDARRRAGPDRGGARLAGQRRHQRRRRLAEGRPHDRPGGRPSLPDPRHPQGRRDRGHGQRLRQGQGRRGLRPGRLDLLPLPPPLAPGAHRRPRGRALPRTGGQGRRPAGPRRLPPDDPRRPALRPPPQHDRDAPPRPLRLHGLHPAARGRSGGRQDPEPGPSP